MGGFVRYGTLNEAGAADSARKRWEDSTDLFGPPEFPFVASAPGVPGADGIIGSSGPAP